MRRGGVRLRANQRPEPWGRTRAYRRVRPTGGVHPHPLGVDHGWSLTTRPRGPWRDVGTAVAQIRNSGFGVGPGFVRSLARHGVWFDPTTFAMDFRRSGHFRIRGSRDLRVVVLDG